MYSEVIQIINQEPPFSWSSSMSFYQHRNFLYYRSLLCTVSTEELEPTDWVYHRILFSIVFLTLQHFSSIIVSSMLLFISVSTDLYPSPQWFRFRLEENHTSTQKTLFVKRSNELQSGLFSHLTINICYKYVKNLHSIFS